MGIAEQTFYRLAQRIRGMEVVEVLDWVVIEHGKPQTIRVDDRPEAISKDVDLWAYWNHVKLDFSRPAPPTPFFRGKSGPSVLFAIGGIGSGELDARHFLPLMEDFIELMGFPGIRHG
jgi:hypothetical protein